jgi:hypothetical protein
MSFDWSHAGVTMAAWNIQYRCNFNGGVLDVCPQDLTPAICAKLRSLHYMIIVFSPQQTRIVEPATAQG